MAVFIISCGGTGGHLSPGIALAEGLRERGHSPLLLISRKGIDSRLIGKYRDLAFERMPGSGFGWRPLKLAGFAASQAGAFVFCSRLLKKRAAAAVVGFGGFTSAPLVAAARLGGVPAVLHEANRVPGRAVRALARFARLIYLPPEVEMPGVGRSKLRHAAMPVRREFAPLPRPVARDALGLDPALPVLLVLGGSQGSTALNEWARASAETLADHGIQLYCITGPDKGRAGTTERRGRDGTTVRSVFQPFSDTMPVLLSAADLVVSRAGAGTIAELTRCRTPGILVPYPHAADDHQRANAEHFERQGGGTMVPQSRMDELLGRVLTMITDEALLGTLRDNLARSEPGDPVGLMLDDLEEIARDGRHDPCDASAEAA